MTLGLAPQPRSKFEIEYLDEDAMEKAPMLDLPFNENVQLRGYSAVNQPNCQIIVEDFMPGQTLEWVFTHDEMQYCLSGEMDLTVWMPPLYEEMVETKVRAGAMYTFPVGARMKLTVTSDVPLRHICFCPPTPDYPFPTLEEIRSQK